MKKKIKTWLIHRLGGVTVSESQEHYKSNAATIVHIYP